MDNFDSNNPTRRRFLAVSGGVALAPILVRPAAAQTTSRGLQTKYAELFGGLQPFIRRSDLRDRGVYYRVLIGPFAAFGEANQLCGSLKKSGGDCVVQRN